VGSEEPLGVTVATVLRSGSHYSPRWVRALAAGVAEHAPGARFVALTDVDVPGVECLPLVGDWQGWWSKVEMFRPGIFDGLTLYVDLDSLVTGPLDCFASYAGELAFLSDFYRPAIPASGVVLFRPGETTERLYREFARDPATIMRQHRRSDYWYSSQVEPDRLQELYPGRIVSLKVHCREKPPGEGVSIVAAHGRPSLHQPGAGWAHEAWSALTSEPVAA
jgi:hypothetical protein